MMIEIPGNPIAKIRARYAKRGNFVACYDPQQKQKDCVIAMLQTKQPSILEGDAFVVDLEFHVAYPSVSQKELNLLSWNIIQHPSNKDVDNLAKFYLDCANGVLYSDDRKIVKLSVSKTYSLNPRTLIRINIMQHQDVKPEARQILEQISKEEFDEFMEDTRKLALNYKLFDDQNMIAQMLSKFADMYHEKLRKINKKCPGFWEKL